eukprot:9851967-Alexandrium_andersonii.AAC.1
MGRTPRSVDLGGPRRDWSVRHSVSPRWVSFGSRRRTVGRLVLRSHPTGSGPGLRCLWLVSPDGGIRVAWGPTRPGIGACRPGRGSAM